MHYLIILSLMFASVIASACPDLTGLFEGNSFNAKTAVDVLKQTNCDSLSLGRVIVENGKIIERFDDLITYQNKELDLCKAGRCRHTFEVSDNRLILFYQGRVRIPDTGNRCNYDSVEYSMSQDKDLQLTYRFVSIDEEDPCHKLGKYTSVQKRIQIEGE